MNIAFIGLGIMGRPMALTLLRAGHALFVHARRAESMTPLIEAGAIGCPSPAEAAARQMSPSPWCRTPRMWSR